MQVRADLIPDISDSHDLGSSNNLWRKGWLSELDATLFAKNTITLLGGYFYVCKNQGTVASAVTAGSSAIDFGTAMTVNDFVAFRSAGQVEYMRVNSYVSGTIYGVVRNLDGSGADAWPMGTPFADLGVSGTGRIEFKAGSDPSDTRISLITQGASYNTSTEVIRLGDLYGMPTYNSSSPIPYGIFIGDATNYLKYDVVSHALSIAGSVNLTNQSSIAISGFNNDAGYITSASAGNQTYYSSTAPTGIKTGDFWFDTSVAGQYKMKRYNGATWDLVSVYMDGTGVYAGNITAGQVTAGTFTGLTFQTDIGVAGHYKRSVISGADNEMHFYDASNNEIVRIGSNIYSSVPGISIYNGIIYSQGTSDVIPIMGSVFSGADGVAVVGQATCYSTGKGIQGIANGTGINYAFYSSATGGASNYSFYGAAGDIYNAGNCNITGALAVTGAVTGSNLAISNWNAAYGWGNHASAGYVTGTAWTSYAQPKL